ncbi:DUF3375 domain-containing protein [Salmonella enterica]|uniref:DUF3375 domain-containing protein n=1 Tax=Salmonella newport TaxID=108619 RepID=A0A5Y0RZA2_SALNE|nr:DUF3375 domain-containing protein [Salmonella enterica]EBS4088851.1 DUF3375 domain-containing protein [Salmonella enterica subsp. enterica serovar Newport]EBS4408716.1 DUF3375 domain-containing protein [Salmonella enterica subsp. enterica serovar Newport]EBV0464755.1 DUF3375 domain-containing protein [Salmonella enterica subsp. enterica serovar Newport]EBX1212436.1 DUF3375 domain-containing protein [Salmonella enterica subsp. enterica serovar Newport]
METDLNFDFLEQFKEQSLALKFLRSTHFSLIASFLNQVFVVPNRRSVPYQELVSLLEQHLFDIAESYGEEKYPKNARNYLDDWINNKGGYLRKYLTQDSDEPECDLLPEVEKVLHWIEELQGRQFVGTESRLKLLLDMIGELVEGTSEDPQQKLQQLKARKAEIEQSITAVELGQDQGFSSTQIRERFYLLSDMSRQLLGDFRQVEANFRQLDKDSRKTISTGGNLKGDVLDKIFAHQDVIDDSDEGKSFSAFFELLMTPKMRNGMRENLQLLLDHEQGREIVCNDRLLMNLYSWLLDAGRKVNATRQQITDQLRRYIQEQSQDNRRVLEIIREFEIEAHRFQIQERECDFISLGGMQAEIDPLFSRQLWQPKRDEQLDDQTVIAGHEPDVDFSQLLSLSHINEQQLQRNILQCLMDNNGQVTLAEVIARHPLDSGLDELLTYIKLACEQVVMANIDQQYKQHISWQPEPSLVRTVLVPKITFVRSS